MRVLVAAVCLLASAATAHAECAWVLWEYKERYWRKFDTLDATWTILKLYDGREECRADQAKLLAGDTAWAPAYSNRKRLDDGFFVAIEVEGKVVGNHQAKSPVRTRYPGPARAEGEVTR